MDIFAREMAVIDAREDDLAARCRAGDLEALEEVYRRWERPVFRYALGMMKNVDEADDVKQETFLKAFRSIGSFGGRCAIHTWLFGICGNICRDRLKLRSRRPESSLDPANGRDWSDDGQGDPLALVLAETSQSLVLEALADLPAHHRQLLLLREVEGLSYEEIRDVLRCSMASVKLRLFRARQEWRRRYLAMTEEGTCHVWQAK